MKTTRKWASWKIAMAAGVGLLVLADITLGVVLWQGAREAPEAMATRRNHLADYDRQIKADNLRGERIRESLSHVGQDSNQFYRDSFLDPQTVYSTVDTNLAQIASKAGVKTTGFKFKEVAAPDHKVTELQISTTVDGDYPALLQFVNGVQHSKIFYFMNQLQLDSSGEEGTRLQIELHTYYRT
jgi:Tfp pilus assembly protein PilO